MKNLIKEHIQRLIEDRTAFQRWLMVHLAEEKTSLYAAVQLGFAWNELKLIFLLAVLGELDDKSNT